jgi:DNA end-binding protein Ku
MYVRRVTNLLRVWHLRRYRQASNHFGEPPMPRPFWSGQVQISLVSFGIQLFPATEAASEIRFHQLNRKTGERIHHQNVSSPDGDGEALDKDEIVKGYEYSKGEYVMIEPEEIENLRIPSRKSLQVAQFVSRDELPPEFFEKPYFVVPEKPEHAEAFAVVRKAMQSGNKVALGKIAFGGREHLLALAAPEDDKHPGMMAYTLRYAAELRDSTQYFRDIKPQTIEKDQLQLAQELIQRKTAPFKPAQFTDEYEAALRALVDAKVKHAPLPKGEPAPKSPKVVNLMDALRKSIQSDQPGEPSSKTSSKKTASHPAKSAATRRGLTLVGAKKTSARAGKSTGKRKSA